MFNRVVPLNSQVHAGMKLNFRSRYAHAKNSHFCSVVLHEFAHLATDYPIVFIKKTDSEKFSPVVLLGLEPGQNLFVDEQGEWLPGVYVPAPFRRYPFVTSRLEGASETLVLCMDDKPELLSLVEGLELFTTDGKETEFLEQTKKFVFDLATFELLSDKFSEKMLELDLLVPTQLSVKNGDEVKQFHGAHIVDEKKLGGLSDDAFISLRQHGFLSAIYAHLISLAQVEKLGARRAPPLPQSLTH